MTGRAARRLRPLAALLALAAAPAGDDLPTRAMRDELERSMDQLRLSGMEKPYFVAYRIDDLDAVSVGATLGSLTSSRPARLRLFSVELRVGDYALDNGNWLSARAMGGPASGAGQAPLSQGGLSVRGVVEAGLPFSAAIVAMTWSSGIAVTSLPESASLFSASPDPQPTDRTRLADPGTYPVTSTSSP